VGAECSPSATSRWIGTSHAPLASDAGSAIEHSSRCSLIRGVVGDLGARQVEAQVEQPKIEHPVAQNDDTEARYRQQHDRHQVVGLDRLGAPDAGALDRLRSAEQHPLGIVKPGPD